MTAPRLLRTIALTIAVLAAIDPSCTRVRRDRPIVSLLGESAAASDDAVRTAVAAALRDRFVVVDGPLPAADAVVLVGDALPAEWQLAPPTQPVFVVPSDTTRPRVQWRGVDAPARVRVGEVARVDALVHVVPAGADDSLIVTARQDGALLARAARAVATPGLVRVPVPVVPVDTGPARLELTVTLRDSAVSATRVSLLDVQTAPVRVAGVDAQPSWHATFARRVLAADPRIEVTSRVVVARGAGGALARTSGVAPTLGALPAPPALDVLVLGAAHALPAGEVAAVERWVRDEGGSVVLLLDGTPTAPVQRWLGVSAWRRVVRAEPVAAIEPATSSDDSSAAPLRGREWLVPARLPAEAEPWLTLAVEPNATGELNAVGAAGAAGEAGAATPSAVVWSRTLGRGTVVVVGALDAWSFREPSRSAFAPTWRRIVTEAAARRAPTIGLEVEPWASSSAWRVARLVGDPAALRAWTGGGVPQFAVVDAGGDTTLLPSLGADGARPIPGPDSALPFLEAAGAPSATAWRLPADVRWQRVIARPGAGAAPALDALVSGEAAPDPAVADVAAIARASGGAVVPAPSLASLADSLTAILAPAERRGAWHPWRSPWWLLPFGAALVGEWWWRRRQGRP